MLGFMGQQANKLLSQGFWAKILAGLLELGIMGRKHVLKLRILGQRSSEAVDFSFLDLSVSKVWGSSDGFEH